MDAKFLFPLQVPNASRAPCAPSTQGSSPPFGPSGSIDSNPTTHYYYTPPSQVPSTQRAFYPPGHHAQTPWSPCRTSPPRLPSSSFNDTSLVYDPALEPESPGRTGLDASFVEMVANSFGFGDCDQEFRASLHSFAQMGGDLSKSDLSTRTYTLGVLYEIMRELRDPELRKTNIHLIAGEVIFEPKRVSYMQIHLDVEARIRKNQKDLRFVCCNVSHQKSLMTAIKHACSSVRNEYFELIRNSVSDDDDKNFTLNDFVYEVATRFQPSNVTMSLVSSMHTPFNMWRSWYRRFALDNPYLLGVGEADEDGDDDYVLLPGGSTASTATNKGSHEEKHKRSTNRQKGGYFWSMVEEWFAAHLTSEQYGPAWDSPGWKMYIKETVDNDHMCFWRRTIENPYFADF
ncbi:hypothetical protein EDB85DRAFT_2160757 [Lactarius pseudohatsudake]|nr:hypothetical protein EDB85DRAFT_2160757 [Lactarius pseudohatsudake]